MSDNNVNLYSFNTFYDTADTFCLTSINIYKFLKKKP